MLGEPITLKSFRDRGIMVNDNLCHVGYLPSMLPLVLLFLAVCTLASFFFAGDYFLTIITDSGQSMGQVSSVYPYSSTVCRGGSGATGGQDVCREEERFQIYYSYQVDGHSYSGSAFLSRAVPYVTVIYQKARPEFHYVREAQEDSGIWAFVLVLLLLYVLIAAGYLRRILHHLCSGKRLLKGAVPEALVVVDDGGGIGTLLHFTEPGGGDRWFVADRRRFSPDDRWDVVLSADGSTYDVYCHPHFHL